MVNTQKTGSGNVDRELNNLVSSGFNPGDLVQRCDDGRIGKVVKVNGILVTTKKFKTITCITRKINGKSETHHVK